jgi:hypothetical protein
MALKLKNLLPGLFSQTVDLGGGVTVDNSGNMVVPGTLGVTGATTQTGAQAFTVAPTGPQVRATASSAAAGATVVLTAADSGKVLINASTSGTPSWTLPAKAAGLYFTFVCGNTTAGFTVTASDAVIHLKTSASGTVLTSTTTITNTQGTAIVGDTISIVCDGTAWWMTAQSGIFAAS